MPKRRPLVRNNVHVEIVGTGSHLARNTFVERRLVSLTPDEVVPTRAEVGALRGVTGEVPLEGDTVGAGRERCRLGRVGKRAIVDLKWVKGAVPPRVDGEAAPYVRDRSIGEKTREEE